uniref:F-box domain-containing protein n=1 Tax=Steinernema glaseri TaxID=37863 RepID=A0A1I7YQH7_9BILA
MNSVPNAFLESVCMQLDKWDLNELTAIRGWWSVIAAIHHNKRRDVWVILDANQKGTQVRIRILEAQSGLSVFSPLDARHDRITNIAFVLRRDEEMLPAEVSFDWFQKKALPVLRSLAFGCQLRFYLDRSFPHYTDSIIDSLHGCSQLEQIFIENCGEKCPEFIKHQINLGHLSCLYLYGTYEWPDSLQTSLKSFLKSPNCRVLDLGSTNLMLDFDMVSCVVERFLKGDFSHCAFLIGKPSFPVARLHNLYVNEQRTYNDEDDEDDIVTNWIGSSERLLARYTSRGTLRLCVRYIF